MLFCTLIEKVYIFLLFVFLVMVWIKNGMVFFLASIMLLNLVSAQYYFDLEYFLRNDAINFALIFIFIFAIVIFSLNRTTFKDSRGAAIVISFVIAFFVSSFLFRNDYLSNLFNLFNIFNARILLYILAIAVLLLVLWKLGLLKNPGN